MSLHTFSNLPQHDYWESHSRPTVSNIFPIRTVRTFSLCSLLDKSLPAIFSFTSNFHIIPTRVIEKDKTPLYISMALIPTISEAVSCHHTTGPQCLSSLYCIISLSSCASYLFDSAFVFCRLFMSELNGPGFQSLKHKHKQFMLHKILP